MMLSSTQLLSTANPAQSSSPITTANLGGALFYAASDSSGNELWKTDGTAAGTVLVKDINPGAASSSPSSLVAVGNAIYFAADDGADGTELWKTDGTTAGTVMVKDLVPGSGSSYPTDLTNVNGKLFFSAVDASGQSALWTSDGTAAGTVELGEVTSASSGPQITNVNGTAFFTGTDPAHGTELWKSDGTPGGTMLVKDIVPGTSSSNPSNLTAFGSELFFTVPNFSSGTPVREMWKSDGTAAGTALFKPGYAAGLSVFDGSLYFTGPDAVGGTAYTNLWKTDGTPVGTVQITESHSFQTSFDPLSYAPLNGTLIFAQYNYYLDDVQLYKTDGTQAGTVNIAPSVHVGNGQGGYDTTLFAANGLVYFVGYSSTTGIGLYQTDGTSAGTVPADRAAIGQVAPIQLMGQANNTLVFAGVANTDPAPVQTHEKVYGLSLGSAPPAAAVLVGSDTATSGSWQGVYGSDGYDLLGGPAGLPGYAQVTVTNAQQWVWQDPSPDPRALQDPAPSTSRTAACDYSGGSFTLDVNLTDGQPHQVALYLLDYDSRNRSENVQVSDAETGRVLDTESVSNFQGGRWLVYDLSGHVTITLTNTGPVNAVASGLMFDPVTAGHQATASFITADNKTFGGWIGTYGTGGYSVIGGATDLPASAQLSTSGAQEYTWADPVADPRALQIAPGTQGRVAAADYSSGSFTLDLNLTDGQPHQVALYVLDFDALGRVETVQVSNAATGALLDSRTVSNFQGGEYLDYLLSGHVKITISNDNHSRQVNAVLSGLFVDPGPIHGTGAGYATTDTVTRGTWTGVYGSQGYDVIGGTESLPSYASLTVNNAQFYQWAAVPTDNTELQTAPGSSNRVAACDYSDAGTFSMNLNLTDGQSHQVALYLLDWDHQNRAETITLADAVTGAQLATTFENNFANGQYLVFDVAGDVTITITKTGGPNAVVSGIFIDPDNATAAFVKTDAITQGTWTGTYGSGGYYLAGGAANLNIHPINSLAPGYAEYTYAASTTDPRALQSSPGSTSRIEAVDYAPTAFTYGTFAMVLQTTHQLAIYVADYDAQGRSETIQLSDARTGAVLDTRFAYNFQGGEYFVWNVSGDLNITFTQVSGPNAVASGVFLD